MNNWINMINYVLVGVFGCILSVAFCGSLRQWKSWKIIIGVTLLTLLLQGLVYTLFGLGAIRKCYPLVTHLPLVLTLWIVQKRFLWPFTAVLTAYLCCQLRRWVALLITEVMGGGDITLTAVQIIITLPLLWLLIRFIVPAMLQLSIRKHREIVQFMIISMIYYMFDYVATVYTSILYSGNKVVVEFMPFVCCVAYFIFVVYTSAKEKERFLLELDRNQLDLQTKQALQEMAVLRQSQEQAAAYRHDLRHHLQYLACCMENDQIAQGQAYIHNICEEIEAQKVVSYCENETVNLILSAYVKRAANANINMKITMSIGESPMISAGDLCVLLSNALENAINECQILNVSGTIGQILVQGYEKNGKTVLQIANNCRDNIVFKDGIPVTERPGHGIGVRSIITIVERYHGIYSFSVKDNMFLLRISI